LAGVALCEAGVVDAGVFERREAEERRAVEEEPREEGGDADGRLPGDVGRDFGLPFRELGFDAAEDELGLVFGLRGGLVAGFFGLAQLVGLFDEALQAGFPGEGAVGGELAVALEDVDGFGGELGVFQLSGALPCCGLAVVGVRIWGLWCGKKGGGGRFVYCETMK